MAARDPEDKRRRLIAAGLEEFSERGLAGARLDRIAKRAECSAGLLYSYFANKEALFDAVFAAIVQRVVDEVPITADDLPGYAVALHSAQRDNPVEVRFAAWYELERVDRDLEETRSAYDAKTAAVRSAQERGIVRADIAPERLLALVLAIAHGYRDPDDGRSGDGGAAIREAVARLVAPSPA